MVYCLLAINPIIAQVDTENQSEDPVEDILLDQMRTDSLAGLTGASIDSSIYLNDSSLGSDTLKVNQVETISIPTASGEIEDNVVYNAEDSIFYDIINEKIYLYGAAHIEQKDISLDAGVIVFDYGLQEVTAMPSLDSLGHIIDRPRFSEGEEEFYSDTLRYNFKTEKGKISQLLTQEGDGFLRSEAVKKNEFDEMFGANAFYTTCNHEHPHFRIQAKKVKVVPKKVIVTGPANLYVGDVPTPLYLPFGIFPISPGRQSGILLPTYGRSPTQGFYLRGGGVYLGLSEHFDLALRADYYTRGSYDLNVASQYRKRYKYDGSFSMNYGNLRQGFSWQEDFRVTRDFFVNWRHTQDPRSIPNSTFTAQVRAGTSTYNQNFLSSTQDYLSNQFNSSINFTHRFQGTPFSLNVGARHSQNTQNRNVTISLPELSLTMRKQTPFQRKVRVGQAKWYEKIGVSYTGNVRNEVSAVDSVIFTNEVWDEMKNGVRHSIPVSMSFNILKHITVTPSFNYNEYWYLKAHKKEWDPSTIIDTTYNSEGAITSIDTTYGQLISGSENGFTTGRDFRGSVSLTTTITGTKIKKTGWLRGIQHVMKPRVGASWRPDFGAESWGYYKEVQNNVDGSTTRYSIFEDGLFGGPPDKRSTSINYSLDNIVEIKVRSRKDSVETEKKVKILESVRFSSSYDLSRDSLRMGNISVNGRTTLFQKLSINFNGSFDPYVKTADGKRVNIYEWTQNKRLGRLNSANVSMSTSLSSGGFSGTNNTSANNIPLEEQELPSDYTYEEQRDVYDRPDQYVDYKIPWRLSLRYNLNITRRQDEDGVEFSNYVQTLNGTFDFNITPKWKVGVTTGYDFQNQDLAHTRINVFRDLHCWEMVFNWIPTGERKRYEFTLRAKSSLLQDLKISRKRDWFDL